MSMGLAMSTAPACHRTAAPVEPVVVGISTETAEAVAHVPETDVAGTATATRTVEVQMPGAPPVSRWPAPAEMAPLTKMIEACAARHEDPPRYGVIQKAAQLGVQSGVPIFHVHMSEKQRQAIIVGDKVPDGEMCPIYWVGRASAGDSGNFLGDGRKLRAFVVPEYDQVCPAKRCTAVVIVRDEQKVFYRVGTTGQTVCDPATAKTAKVFDGQDSLALVCESPSGAGDHEATLVMFHAEADSLVPVLVAPLGTRTVEYDEESEKYCERPALGTWRVAKKGAEPAIEVFSPDESQDLSEDGPQGQLVTWTWSARDKVFVAGAPTPHVAGAWPKTVCRR
jgi:hypothetical protein